MVDDPPQEDIQEENSRQRKRVKVSVSEMFESFKEMVQGRDQALAKLEEVHNEINTIKNYVNELGKKITEIKEFI
ncbi:hypothetical protein C2G38_2115440 [Gigaspora rosea]|uniref:Uncharacterized protein n=1 Tax=Gigaspora rosea TaxID=44941 RepID=A0A397U8T6_9GLOM|nr:hypothetical protein C2G38_2115440 [Gigaspora rosea]